MLTKLYKYVLIACLALITVNVYAQKWSYVYIQGDKEIPFYVKLEGEMLPRYSKHYYIIPELGPGPINIEILFQQNAYPPLSFKILVPDAGYRGFLLVHKDNNFALYDIQQRFYLLPGEQGEDHLPEIIPIAVSKKQQAAEPKAEKVRTKQKVRKEPEQKPAKQETAVEETGEPNFIEDIELVSEHAVPEQSPPVNRPVIREEPRREAPIEPTETSVAEEDYRRTEGQVNLNDNSAPIINSDCPEPMGDVEFDKVYTTAQEKKKGDKRMDYLMDKVKGNCYTTRQVYFLARQLQAESMRYSFLKKVYPRVTDQQNFHLLEEPLFKTLEWKSYFRLIQ